MYYWQIRERLLETVQSRVTNGELTERRLARHIGVSQPHMHNVLKGVRILSPALVDSLLRHLGISILDLALREELRHALDQVDELPRSFQS